MLSESKSLVDMSVSDLAVLIESKQNRIELLEQTLSSPLSGGADFSESTSMGQLQLAIDDIGWQPLGGMTDSRMELPLDTIKKVAELCRTLIDVNPLVKRGVAVRSGYIWGRGVSIVSQGNTRGRPTSNPTLPTSVAYTMGTTLAQLELERTAAADGNLFFLVDSRRRSVERIPLQQIAGKMTAPGNKENILYFKRSWSSEEVDLGTGAPVAGVPMEERWYPSSRLEGAVRTDRIMNVPVDGTKRIVHIPFNRKTGQSWGMPDIFAVIWWVRAYKEYLENCATLTKAYAQFAWKVTSETGKGTARVASQLANPPQRDPATGQALNVGASVALGAGQDLQAISRNTSVDFDAGRALAALVAAGLEVPLPALTSDPSDGNRATAETLDDPTLLAMLARQQMMDDAFQEVFRIMRIEGQVQWPEIAPEPLHRRIQAADMAIRSGSFTADESRELMKEMLGDRWKDLPEGAPTLEQLPVLLKKEAEGPPQVDPMSRGDHSLRDEGTQAHTD